MKDVWIRMIDKQSGQVVLEWKLENKIEEQNYNKQNSEDNVDIIKYDE